MQDAVTYPVVILHCEGNLLDLIRNQNFKLLLPVRVISVAQYICPRSVYKDSNISTNTTQHNSKRSVYAGRNVVCTSWSVQYLHSSMLWMASQSKLPSPHLQDTRQEWTAPCVGWTSSCVAVDSWLP